MCKLLKRIKENKWKKGGTSSIYYIAIMWIITFAVFLFLEYFNGYTTAGRTQLLADLLADGSVFIGNTGWGLDEKKASSAFKELGELNKESFKNITTKSKKYYYTDKKGKVASNAKVYGANKNNTMKATVKAKANSITTFTDAINVANSGDTHITYSGGMKIVYEAWTHTWEHMLLYGSPAQTKYVWGGGHGNLGEWKQYADCSGFVGGVFRECGYNTVYGCTWDMEFAGKTMYKGGSYSAAAAAAQPGDIILYWYGGSADGGSMHVVIYAGEYKGTPYVVECTGGRVCTYDTPGWGSQKGAHLFPMKTSCSCYKVQRIVDSTAKPARVPKVTYAGWSKTETDLYNMLRGMGVPPTQICGILGNVMCEGSEPYMCEGWYGNLEFLSILFSNAVAKGKVSKHDWIWESAGREDGGPCGYGVCQWTDIGRKSNLWEYAVSKGSNVTDLNVQAAFIVKELQDFGMIDEFYSKTSIDAAVEYLYYNYEIPPDDDESLPNRKAKAKKYKNPKVVISGYY